MGIIEKIRADARAIQVAQTDTKAEAIAMANAYLNNVGLPCYAETPAVVLVEIKNVYGTLKAYPANEAAELLAQIAGTKTLSNQTLALAERMGMVIQQKQLNQLKELA